MMGFCLCFVPLVVMAGFSMGSEYNITSEVQAINDMICFLELPNPEPIEEIFPQVEVHRNRRTPVAKNCNVTPKELVDEIAPLLSGAERVIFVTHGFRDNMKAKWLGDIMKNILYHDRKDQVVILVGWPAGAAAKWSLEYYMQPAANTETIGRYLGEVARVIYDYDRSQRFPRQIYGVGHSLGSHVMGWAGRVSKVFTRITALDPAGPCFEVKYRNKSLRSTDAGLVDVIHTDGYHSLFPPQLHFGTLLPMGDLDFYPNWGHRMQPGCTRLMTACSHSRAIDLYIWTLSHPGRLATKLNVSSVPTAYEIQEKYDISKTSWAEAGYYADERHSTYSGRWYFPTNSADPWTTLSKRPFIILHESNKVLDACGGGSCRVGVDVILHRHHGGDNQQWYSDGELIRNVKWPERVLDFDFKDYRAGHYGRVYLNTQVHTRASQRWIFLKPYSIENYYKGLQMVLDVKGGQVYDGAEVGCYPSNGTPAQMWKKRYVPRK